MYNNSNVLFSTIELMKICFFFKSLIYNLENYNCVKLTQKKKDRKNKIKGKTG